MQGFFNIHKSIRMIHQINKLRNKNPKIILIGGERTLDKIKHPFMITLQKYTEVIYLNVIKALYDKLTGSIIQW